MGEWAKKTFVDKNGPLFNKDHAHLKFADVLFVWSSVSFRSKGRTVVGTAQEGRQQGGGPGKKDFSEFLYREWNGGKLPTFVITLAAPFFAEADPTSILAVVEHELYHCGQQRDEFGFPKFNKDGLPMFAMRGHDIEEFVGVVKRYGSTSPEMNALKDALNSPRAVSTERAKDAFCGCGARL